MGNNHKQPDSTARANADTRLREYEKVVEGLEEMIAVVDRNYCYLLANQAFLKHRGMKEREQVVGRLISEVLGKDVFEQVIKQRLDECFQGKIVRYEMTYRYPEIGERDLSISYLPIEGPDGIDRVACVLHDITEKKQAEEFLRQNEHQLVEAQHVAQIGSWTWDLQKNSRTWSKELYAIFGLDPEAPAPSVDAALIDFVHPDDREAVFRNIDTSVKSAQPCSFFYRIIRPDGTERMIHSRGNVVADESGNSIRMFGTAQDITDRRRAEDALREAEQKYRDIFEHAGEGIFQSTPEGRFIVANPALARMHGFDSPEDLIRSRGDISRQVYVDPARREEFKRLLEENGIVRGFEHQLFRKDGSKIWISVNARAVRDEAGAIRYYEGTAQDINERKLAQARSAAFATLARKLSGARTPLDAGRIIVQTARSLFGWDSCDLNHYDADRDLVYQMLNIDIIDGQPTEVFGVISGRQPTVRGRRIIDHGPELILREEPVQFDADAKPYGDRARPSASIMTVPIRHADRVIGLLSIQSYTPYSYDNVALDDLQALADHCGEAMNRIRAEQSLTESEERFRQMADNFEDVIWIADKDISRILYVNPAYEKVFGRSCVSLYERLTSFIEAVHPDDRTHMERMLELQREGDLTSVEYRIVHPDGSVRWIQRRSFPIRNNEGEVYRIAGIAQDITERIRAEQALRLSEERYRKVAENFPNGAVITYDKDLRVTFIGGRGLEEAGVSADLFVGKSLAEIAPPEVVAIAEPHFRAAFAGRTESYECPYPDGRAYFAAVAPLVNGRGLIDEILVISQDITEHKRAQEERRESEERYRDLVENSREFFCTHNLDGLVLSANRAAAEALGYDLNDLVGKRSVRDILAPEVRHQFDEYMARVGRDGETSGFMLVQTSSGERRLWEFYNSVRTEGVSTPIVRAMARDITERKRAEQSLQLFRNLIDQSNDAIEVIDPITFRFLDCNQSAYRSLGYTREEFLALTVFDIDPLVDPSVMARLDEEMNESGSATLKSLHRRKDGTTFPVEVNVKLVKLERVYRLAFVRDISGRERAEAALRISEERYRELFENARDAIYVHDLSGRYTSVNRAAEQLSGFTREEILGKHFSNFVSPRDLKEVRTNLCRKLDDENETVYEVDVATRSGQRVPVEISSRLIYENGVAVGVQGTARDIGDRKRAQEALRIYSQRLIQAQEAEREKIARELHDQIGQILTAVRINLQSIQRSYGSNENIPRFDDSIAIIDEALGRVRELSIELRPSLLDDLGLTAALRWYVDHFAQRTGIIAEVLNGSKEEGRLPHDLETACFRIAQEALTNVARHAKASSVSVQLEHAREKMLLTVIDDGIGFDIDSLRKNMLAASALGLRGMEERALAAGGYIKIDSGSGRGTRVRATFPLGRK